MQFPEEDGTFKWSNLRQWYAEWESQKEEAQAEQRVLEEKVRQGEASSEDLEKLKEVKKQAKVTTGASTFKSIYQDILNGNVDKLKLESFVDKVNLPYNSLVIVDDSGSMQGQPFNFAKFMTSVCLVKNPDDTGRNMLGLFGADSVLYQYIDVKARDTTPNQIFARRNNNYVTCAPHAFVDPKKSFYDNYLNIANFMECKYRGGWTDVSAIPEGFHKMAENNPDLLDALRNYPVWTIISDKQHCRLI